jgi:hypothetical protein
MSETSTITRVTGPKRGYERARSFAAIGSNNNNNGTRVRAPKRNPTRRHYIGGTIFIILHAVIFFHWAGFAANNTIFEYGHPTLGSELPGPLKSSRYTYEWWLVWTLSLNGLSPLLLAISLTENKVEEYARLHGFVSALLLVISGVVFILMLIQWCINCNTAFSSASTWCNDYRWCCAHFGASQEAIERCANSTPCIPDVVSSALSVNGEWITHMVHAFVLTLLNLASLAVKDSLSKFGIYTNQG